MKIHWNKQLYALHRIVGLVVGCMLLLMSLTGSMLVFSDEIDHLQYAHAWHVTPQASPKPLQELLQQAQQSLPGKPYVYFMQLPQAADESALLRADYSADNKMYLLVNPYSGQILQKFSNKSNFSSLLLYLHFTLLSGKTGAIIVLITAIGLFLTVLTGLFIYRKAIVKVLTFRMKLEWQHPGKRWRNLHRLLGVWALLFNLVISFTGFMLELKVLDSRKKANTGYTAIPFNADYDALVAKARTVIPGFKPIGLRPPRKAGDPLRIVGKGHESAFWGKYSSSVFFDTSGKVTKKVDFSNASFGDRFNACISPLHYGNYGGILLKIVYSFLALTPGILSVSGFLIWYKRKKAHQLSSKNKQQKMKMAA
ncbi:PepSY-associated TM helix domain-containing protein [Chitinophaga sp. 30R24]|uniref:PepSY-associated TM helix domain-containing protein n=1 Tax=Chitinophaga sp. 30R24 TaxID=3248838 RepID=UPI003B90FC16